MTGGPACSCFYAHRPVAGPGTSKDGGRCDSGGRRGQGRVAWAALCMLPDPPAPARETPAQRYRPAEGRAGLSGTGFPALLPAGGSGHGGAGTLGGPGCGHWAGSAASEGPTDATSARTTASHAPARRRWPRREDRVLRPHRGSRAIAAAPLRPSERPGPGDR